ncbi:unnamed protein product [Scytosiphon promiscuus]
MSAIAGADSSGLGEGLDEGAAQWTLWQLCDSGLPTGGFAHSGGLEAAAAQGMVRAKHTGSLLRFVRGALANAASLQLPLVREALEGRTLGAWLEVDFVAHACITAEAARRASLAQGAGLLRAAQAMFPLGKECGEMISDFRALVRGGSAAFSGVPVRRTTAATGDSSEAPVAGVASPAEQPSDAANKSERRGTIAHGHHAPAFGVVCRALGIRERRATRAFMFLVARDIMSAATRLSLIGPLEAGRLVSSLSGYVETLVAMGEFEESLGDTTTEEEDSVSDEENGGRKGQDEEPGLLSAEWGGGGGVAGRVCQVDPVQDIVQGLHDRLYSRMFNS